MPVTILGTQITLWCFDAQNSSKFKVTIGNKNDIDDLKEVIKEKKHNEFAGVDAGMLQLWRVNTDRSISKENELKDTAQLIRNAFPDVQGSNIRALVRVRGPFITERELFRVNLPLPGLYDITTATTTISTLRRAPDIPVLPWETFLDCALTASLSISNTNRKFHKPNINKAFLHSENTTVNKFLRTMNEINNQRLEQLPKPERWDIRENCTMALGKPDVIRFCANDKDSLESINNTKILAVILVKPEQLMADLIAGTEITDGEVEITNRREELFELYNSAVEMVDDSIDKYVKHDKLKKIVRQAFGYMVINDLQYGMITSYARTWFLSRNPQNANILHISPMIPINQRHTNDCASFLECMHYFENISRDNPNIHSSPPTTADNDDNDDDDDQIDSDQSDHSDYEPTKSKNRKTIKSKVNTQNTWNTQKSARTGSKITTLGANKAIMEEFKHKSDDKLLIDMKNYDRKRFYFGKILGFGRSGRVIMAKLCGKSGALKMVDLYTNDIQLKEMLNEIKMYLIPLKEIQGIYIPKLLKFGVLHEAFVFMLTSFAGESFAKKRNITEKEKQLAIDGLMRIHTKGVKHGDIRLENIMIKRNELMDRSFVWWIDFAWSKMTDNAKDLNTELSELKRLLGTC